MRALPNPNSDWISDTLAPITGRRSAARLRLSIPAKLVTLGDTRRCILVDLSRTGAQVGLELPLRKGEGAILQLAGIDQFGEIVRHDVGPNGGVNGIAFDEALTEEEVLAVRQYSESFEEESLKSIRREVRAWVNGIG